MGPGSPFRRGTFWGQILKLWFAIGTATHTAACKLFKNLKYAKIGLAVGTLDQFVMKFRGQSVFQTVAAIRSNKICRF